MTPRPSRWRVVLRGGEEEEEPGRNTRANPSKLSGRPIERRALQRAANPKEGAGLILARNQWSAPNGAERRAAGAMTDLYSGLGGGPAPERRREEGRPPPPPSWTGPVQLPWSRRQSLPGLPLIPESPTRSSRTIPGPLPLSTTQPHFRLSRPLIAIAPGLGARGKRKKKKKKAAGGRSPLSPPSSPVAIRSAAAAPAPAVSVRFDWAGPLPLFPQLHRPTYCSATLPPVATRPQLPPGPGRALGPSFGSGGRGPSPLSVLPRPDSRVAERRPRVRGARPPPRLAGLGAVGAQRAAEGSFCSGRGAHSCSHAFPGSSIRERCLSAPESSSLLVS